MRANLFSISISLALALAAPAWAQDSKTMVGGVDVRECPATQTHLLELIAQLSLRTANFAAKLDLTDADNQAQVKQAEAVNRYWAEWCGDVPGCAVGPKLSAAEPAKP